jgi:hypothetical protein
MEKGEKGEKKRNVAFFFNFEKTTRKHNNDK